MWLKRIFQLLKEKNQTAKNKMPVQTRETISMHEAAHGIVWYLFKENWNVNSLSIDPENLPEEGMKGQLHISPNFQEDDKNINRASELLAILLAGLIGQNMNLILEKSNLVSDLMNVNHYNQILDETGCSGDYDYARGILPNLSNAFNKSEYNIAKYTILDLILIFQNHQKVVDIHSDLTKLLLNKGTLNREDLINFFEEQNFQEFIEDENLDNAFHHYR